MLLALLIPLYYTVGDRRGSALQTYLLRSLGELFAMFLTMGLLFVPKVIYVLRGVRKGERTDGEESNFQTTARGSINADTTTMGTSRGINYTEFSDSDRSDSDYDAGQAGGASMAEESSNRPGFVSMNISRGSSAPTDSFTAGSGTAGTESGTGNNFRL